MSEQTILTNQSPSNRDNHASEVSIIALLQELQQTPKEYWSNLLQIIRLYRESVTLKTEVSENIEQKIFESEKLSQQHQALSELTREWIEDGDEKEQTETWNYLHQALHEDRL